MEAKLKAKWVKALRSGKYAQAEGQLRRNGGYCCLGVLCEIAPGVKLDESGNASTGRYPYEEHLGFSDLEGPGCKLFGIPKRVHNRLIQLNDGEDAQGLRTDPKNFNQIADWIEKSKQL